VAWSADLLYTPVAILCVINAAASKSLSSV